jgi:hypothetical protein
VPGRYGGVIGGDAGEGNCCTNVKTLELDGPLRGRILCRGVDDGVTKDACAKKSAGISWGFHIPQRDLTAASGRKECLKKSKLSPEWRCSLTDKTSDILCLRAL